jgi:hypothetical protein
MEPDDEVIDRPKGTLITATILLVTAAWMSYRMPAAIRSFEEMFVAFGADVSGPAAWVLAMPYFWLVFVALAVALLVWIMARTRVTRAEHGRMKIALGATIVVMVLAWGFAAWAIYQPILELGEAV